MKLGLSLLSGLVLGLAAMPAAGHAAREPIRIACADQTDASRTETARAERRMVAIRFATPETKPRPTPAKRRYLLM